jgi:hypothetical protein
MVPVQFPTISSLHRPTISRSQLIVDGLLASYTPQGQGFIHLLTIFISSTDGLTVGTILVILNAFRGMLISERLRSRSIFTRPFEI